MKILIVDDSPPAREPLELKLESMGHSITAADDGLQAFQAFKREKFDLIITDIRMPVMDGLELLRQVKKISPAQDVILITGYSDLDSSVEALRHGARNYLRKPVKLDELAMSVNTVEERLNMDRKIREQEARLVQADKMAELGIAAAGIAHEINNPNTYLRGNIQTLMRFWKELSPYLNEAAASVKPPPNFHFIMKEIPEILEDMLSGSTRIKKIVESMVTFTRLRGDDNFNSVNLNSCVEKAIESPEVQAAHEIIKFVPDDGLPRVTATEEGVTSIIIEVLSNSIRAVREVEGPNIEIRTFSPASQQVFLDIKDNGPGIKEEDSKKVLTPFFTTEPRIGRPGLGLSKAYALVKRFGGDLRIDSQEGRGTKVSLRFPASRERNST